MTRDRYILNCIKGGILGLVGFLLVASMIVGSVVYSHDKDIAEQKENKAEIWEHFSPHIESDGTLLVEDNELSPSQKAVLKENGYTCEGTFRHLISNGDSFDGYQYQCKYFDKEKAKKDKLEKNKAKKDKYKTPW
jgi:hypothetical protein